GDHFRRAVHEAWSAGRGARRRALVARTVVPIVLAASRGAGWHRSGGPRLRAGGVGGALRRRAAARALRFVDVRPPVDQSRPGAAAELTRNGQHERNETASQPRCAAFGRRPGELSAGGKMGRLGRVRYRAMAAQSREALPDYSDDLL